MNSAKTQTVNLSLKSDLALEANHAKYLGVIIDSKLDWQAHINYIANKLNTIHFQIKKLALYCSRDAVLTFYHSNFISILNYGIILWGYSPHVHRIFCIQKRAVRTLLNVTDQSTHCKPLFRKLYLLPLPCLYIYNLLVYGYENHNSFLKNSDCHAHNTRNQHKFVPPLYRLNQNAKKRCKVQLCKTSKCVTLSVY